jgi:hypothetical protein
MPIALVLSLASLCVAAPRFVDLDQPGALASLEKLDPAEESWIPGR